MNEIPAGVGAAERRGPTRVRAALKQQLSVQVELIEMALAVMRADALRHLPRHGVGMIERLPGRVDRELAVPRVGIVVAMVTRQVIEEAQWPPGARLVDD